VDGFLTFGDMITRDVLNSPESFFKHLFSRDDENSGDA
jgi:hypothetical protein